MTPDLLALLTPEQQEAWMRCMNRVAGAWDNRDYFNDAQSWRLLPAALTELAQTKKALEAAERCMVTEGVRLHKMAKETRETWQQRAEVAEKALAEAESEREGKK